MNIKSIITHGIIIIFFALSSYGLTSSIAVKSTLGIIFAIIGLGAAAFFLYLLPKLYQQPNEKESQDQ